MSCDVGKATERLENELRLGEVMERLENELWVSLDIKRCEEKSPA